jgi:hypothetical protein
MSDPAYTKWNQMANITSLVVGEGITSIDGHILWASRNVTTITLPASLRTITGTHIFHCADRLATININATAPPTMNIDIFVTTDVGSIVGNIGSIAHAALVNLVVPANNACNYAADTNWNKFEHAGVGGNILRKYFGKVFPSTSITNTRAATTTIRFYIDCDSKMTITDSGAMQNFAANGTTQPWYNIRVNNIKSIVMDKDITTVGNYAFYGCTALTTVIAKRAAAPTLDTDAFGGITPLDKITLRIPNSSVLSYGTTNTWKDMTIPQLQVRFHLEY